MTVVKRAITGSVDAFGQQASGSGVSKKGKQETRPEQDKAIQKGKIYQVQKVPNHTFWVHALLFGWLDKCGHCKVSRAV